MTVGNNLSVKGKVIIAGNTSVGKSSLLKCLTSNGTTFLKNYAMTSGIDFEPKTFSFDEMQDTVEFLFLDCAGNEIYDDLIKKSLPKDCLVCLVADVTNKKSFEDISKWFDLVQDYSSKSNPGLLILNKTDLESRRYVSENSARELAQKYKLMCFECSAKDNKNVQEAFQALAKEYLRRKT